MTATVLHAKVSLTFGVGDPQSVMGMDKPLKPQEIHSASRVASAYSSCFTRNTPILVTSNLWAMPLAAPRLSTSQDSWPHHTGAPGTEGLRSEVSQARCHYIHPVTFLVGAHRRSSP